METAADETRLKMMCCFGFDYIEQGNLFKFNCNRPLGYTYANFR